MKATIKEIEDKAFKPFTLEIEVNTLEEARELWHRLIIEAGDKLANNVTHHAYPNDSTLTIFKVLDNRLKPFEERNN